MKGPESRAGMKPRTRAVLMTPVALLTYYGVPSSLAFGGDIAHAPDLGTLARSGITHTPDLGTIPNQEKPTEGAKCTAVMFFNAGPRRKVEFTLYTGDTGPNIDSASPQPAVAGPYPTVVIYRDQATSFNAKSPEKRAMAVIVTDPDEKKARGIKIDGTSVDLSSAYQRDFLVKNKGSRMGDSMVEVLFGDRIRPDGYEGQVNCEPAQIPAWLTDVNKVDPKAIAVFINTNVSASN